MFLVLALCFDSTKFWSLCTKQRYYSKLYLSSIVLDDFMDIMPFNSMLYSLLYKKIKAFALSSTLNPTEAGKIWSMTGPSQVSKAPIGMDASYSLKI